MTDWREITIGEFAPFSYGKSLPERTRIKGSFKVYGSSGHVGSHNTPLSDVPGIVIGRKGTVGSVTLATEPFWPIDTVFYIIDEPGKRDLRFTFYALSQIGLEYMNSDSAVPGLNRDNAHAIRLRIPPLCEQREIAATLGSLDDKIELNRKTAVTLEEMARALYRSWFVDFDPVHAKAAGRPPAHMDAQTAALFPDSFGEDGLPEGWEFSTVSAVCKHVKQTVKPMERIEHLFHHFSLPAFDAGRAPVLEYGKEIKSNKLFVPDNSILFSRLNPSIPRVWWAQTNEDVAVPAASTEFYVAKAFEVIQTPWLYCLMSSSSFRYEALSRVTGTSNSHQRVPPKAFAEIGAIKPVDDLLTAFGEVCTDWFARIHAMGKENETLATLRDTLLPRLMSGELRVGEAKKQVEAVA